MKDIGEPDQNQSFLVILSLFFHCFPIIFSPWNIHHVKFHIQNNERMINFNICFESNIGAHLVLIACCSQNYTFKMFSKE